MIIPTREDILKASEEIKPHIHRTPVLSSSSINNWCGAEVFFKCENFQKIGAFKIRGATHAVLSLSEEHRSKGIATHSSGNHAQAIALSAQKMGIPAYIVMPETSPKVKVEAVKGYGAEITFCAPTLKAREDTLQQVTDRTGATFIHPFNDWKIITGQATVVKELLEEKPDLNVVVAPVGGGGLLSGSALAAHYFSEETQVWAGEPEGADDAFHSLQQGKIIPSLHPKTIADGLLTSLGEKTFHVMQKHVSGIITVSDAEILTAMRWIWERMKLVVEPSGAVALAAVAKNKNQWSGQKVGVVISGGNVDLGMWANKFF